MPLACMRLPVPKSLLLKSRFRDQGSLFGDLGLELGARGLANHEKKDGAEEGFA